MLILLTSTNFNNNYLEKPKKRGYRGSVFINYRTSISTLFWLFEVIIVKILYKLVESAFNDSYGGPFSVCQIISPYYFTEGHAVFP